MSRETVTFDLINIFYEGIVYLTHFSFLANVSILYPLKKQGNF